MACYRPLAGVRIGQTENGKPKYNIVSMTDHCLDDFPKEDVIQIPCGKCLGCRMDYARHWQNRLLMELKCHDVAWFCTMTYDEENVNRILLEDDAGSLVEMETLCKKDVQDFMKRLRDHFPKDNIKYFITGEYGEQTLRPHMHGIIFGCHLDDVKPKIGIKSVNGEQVYYSKKFEEIWSKGLCELGTVTPESCSYVSRYVTKKLKNGEKEELYAKGLEKEFALMSRKPAIGRKYFDMNPNMFENGNAFLALKNGSEKIMPDRYFKALIDNQDKKAQRYVASKLIRESKLNMTDLNYLDYLETEENTLKNKTKIFTRNKI